MQITVNPELTTDEPDKLPEGVFLEAEWDPEQYPGRSELFRANGRVYTLAKRVDPRLAFRYMRDLRRNTDQEIAMANLLGSVLGDAIMDVLAEEELSDDQLRTVMKAVTKHTMGALERTLGK